MTEPSDATHHKRNGLVMVICAIIVLAGGIMIGWMIPHRDDSVEWDRLGRVAHAKMVADPDFRKRPEVSNCYLSSNTIA